MIYLELLHGRTDPAQSLNDWGMEGPVFGPLTYAHTTYAFDIKLGNAEEGGIGDLTWNASNLVYYDGVYYGDVSVFDESLLSNRLRGRVRPFDPALARDPNLPPF